MNDNDKINDILNELDNKSADDAPEAPPETAPETAPEPETEPAAPEAHVYPSHAKEPEPVQPRPYPGSRPGGAPHRSAQPVHDQDRNKKRRHKKKKQRSRLPGVLILTTFIFGVSVVLSLVIIGYGKDMLGIGKSDRTHLLIIPEGATTEDIANMLEDDGIIKSPEAFKLFSRLRHSDGLYIPGEHFVSPSMAYETIINELTTVKEEEMGESVQITFPEGITIIDAAYKLQDEGICDAEDFMFYFNSGGFGFEFEDRVPLAQSSTNKFKRMEGYVFPDTYFFYENMDVEQVCQKIYMNFDNKISGVFDEKTGQTRYERMDELGITLDQLVTFASIVQKEAATTDSMTLVASVFWNRLNNSDEFPKLQSDPTSNYANDVIRPNMEVFDEAIVNAYDTYKSPGLPPGAICNPGIEAIDAVLTAFESEYFYFVANIDTGETLYAVTNEEHEENVAIIEQQYEDARLAAEAAAAEAEY